MLRNTRSKGYDGLLGFVGGIHAGNYDITRVFIDGLYKITGERTQPRLRLSSTS